MKNLKLINYLIILLFVGTGVISCKKSKDQMQNPLLTETNQIIDFKSVIAQSVRGATDISIQNAKYNLINIYGIKNTDRTFENTMQSLDNIYNDLMKINEIVSLLAYVHPIDEIRNKCLECTAEFGKFFNEISLSEELYNAVKSFSTSNEADRFTGAKKKYLIETVEEFERNGFALSKEKRQELKLYKDKLSDLGIQFDANISSYQDFLIATEQQMDGLPEDYKKSHLQEDGTYKIGLEYPSYIPFMKYSKSDESRKELARKYKNTAADKNLDILKQILVEREKMAKLLGYKTFAEYRTENRMAKSPEVVWNFENSLKEKVRPKAESDYQELLEIKREFKNDITTQSVESWEAMFYNNILLKEKYELDNQKLKEYFEVGNVIDGLFQIAQHLYGVSFEEIKNPSVWHQDVRFYEVKEQGNLVARFYLDLYPRENKYNHAAMFGMIPGKLMDNEYQIPTASLVCNFPKATAEMPALMPHNDVETFFHEFGHLMHDLLTKAELASQAGTNVARYFV